MDDDTATALAQIILARRIGEMEIQIAHLEAQNQLLRQQAAATPATDGAP